MASAVPQFSADSEGLSLETLGAILEQSHDCIKIMGVDGSLNFMSPGGQHVMQVDDFSKISGQHWCDLWPEDTADLIHGAIAKAQNGVSNTFEAFCPTAKGEPRWWHVSVAPLKGASGEVSALLSISRDITDQVNARQASQAIAGEMRHRVRNAYALSAALARSLARGNDVVEDFASDLGMRLSHLGEAQNLLLDEAEGANLGELMHRLVEAYQGRDEVIIVDGMPDALLNDRQAQGLALAIGELSTNSHKYGALKNGLPVHVAGETKDGELILTWREEAQRSDGMPNSPNSAGVLGDGDTGDQHNGEQHFGGQRAGGQGKELMRRFLAAIGGTMNHHWGEKELTVLIRFPLADHSSTPKAA